MGHTLESIGRSQATSEMSFTARKKILKEKGDLRDLYIMSAKEVDTSGGRKAVVIHVPFRLRKGFQKIQDRLVRELEKKFSGKHVVIVAHRKIMKPPKSGYS